MTKKERREVAIRMMHIKIHQFYNSKTYQDLDRRMAYFSGELFMAYSAELISDDDWEELNRLRVDARDEALERIMKEEK